MWVSMLIEAGLPQVVYAGDDALAALDAVHHLVPEWCDCDVVAAVDNGDGVQVHLNDCDSVVVCEAGPAEAKGGELIDFELS